MPIRFVHFAMRGYTRSKRTSEETGSVAYLPDRHRCLEGGPPRLGDAVEITCLDLWAPLYPACLQKVGEQPVTNGQAQTIRKNGITVARKTAIAMASMTAQKALARELELAPALAARLAFSPAWDYLRSLGLGPW